jgi:hypothetical protein
MPIRQSADRGRCMVVVGLVHTVSIAKISQKHTKMHSLRGSAPRAKAMNCGPLPPLYRG